MAEIKIEKLRDFPAVEELMQSPRIAAAGHKLPRLITVAIVKKTIAGLKEIVKRKSGIVTLDRLYRDINANLSVNASRRISRVINASGIVVHTNLGRAPLSDQLFDAIKEKVTGYSNLEYDLQSGSRGQRGTVCEDYLAALSGAEGATVVNNGAAALFIILNTLANRKKVIISRGELVQIGGGFRIPDILKRSGARLSEVGTTNVTTEADYEKAVDASTALILKVHKSNFVQAGFTGEVPLRQLVTLGNKLGLPIINDLGSGVFVQTKTLLGYDEPTVQQSVRTGADLTCFSGDKMLGGMQAGLIVGRADMIARIKKNPIFRAVRGDKMLFSILEELLSVYLNGTYQTDIKLWSLLSAPVATLRKRGTSILKSLGAPTGLSVQATRSLVGGGALPESELPSVGLVFSDQMSPEKLAEKFRQCSPPVIGRIENDHFILDLKAVDANEIELLINAIKTVIT